ncbi:MAG: glycoside hydrolase family 130 protein, partial [Isosphaeraceae bacterium]
MIRLVNGKANLPCQLNVKRTGIVIRPNNSRVVIRPFEPASENRIERILGRVAALSEAEIDLLLEDVLREFWNRHQKTRQFFLRRFEQIKSHLLTDQPLSENRKLLMGAYFTQEYALESAALFNPSMIWHPDPSGLQAGSRRFILSLRATGEGHISSIPFRGGVIDGQNQIHIDEPTRFVTAPELVPNTLYDKRLFARKLIELGVDSPFAEQVLTTLGDQFTHDDIQRSISRSLQQNRPRHRELEPVAQNMLTLVQSNYEIFFSPELNLSERIIFPSSPTEINGIEDARFVEFHDDDGSVRYYATYTAFDGKVILPQILETEDFLRFKASTLNGPEVRNKGLALFPRRINGLYAMLSRQDNENIYLMYSDMLHFWYTKEQIAKPTYGWEFVQLGNCGSPLETEAGWLVLTHGVGPMRKYAMGAFLLDLNDPSR